MSTSKLQRQVSALLGVHLGQYTIRENHRPEWLDGLELDFYIEELRVGIEVQGQQHYEYVPMFHQDYDGFLAQQERDEHKADLCQHLDVALHYVETAHEILPLIERLIKKQLPETTHPNFISKQAKQDDAIKVRRFHKMIQTKSVQSLIRTIRYYRHLRDQATGAQREAIGRTIVHRTNRLHDALKHRFSEEQVQEFMALV